MRRSRRRENDDRDTSCRLHAPTYVCRRCDLRDNVNSLVKGPAERNCRQVRKGEREEGGREREREREQNDRMRKKENEGKEIRPCRSLHMYTRTHAYIYYIVHHIYMYIHIYMTCIDVYIYTCVYVRGTGHVRLYTRCNEHVLFRLTLVQCLARVDPLSIPLYLYPSSDSGLASWQNKNVAGRESAMLPSRRLREERRRRRRQWRA